MQDIGKLSYISPQRLHQVQVGEHGYSITGPEPHGVSVDGYGGWPQGQSEDAQRQKIRTCEPGIVLPKDPSLRASLAGARRRLLSLGHSAIITLRRRRVQYKRLK